MTNKIVVSFELPTSYVEQYMHRTAFIVNEMNKLKETMDTEMELTIEEKTFIEYDIAISTSIWQQCATYLNFHHIQSKIEPEEFPANVISEVNDILVNMRKG